MVVTRTSGFKLPYARKYCPGSVSEKTTFLCKGNWVYVSGLVLEKAEVLRLLGFAHGGRGAD
eukprot:14866168-Heterocapsa_arctica.AAC.1